MIKQIISFKDLAINGAPPAFDTPLHVGRPNIGNRQTFLKYASEIFDSRWLTNNGRFVQELERKVAVLHNVKHCVAVCNGTIALEIAIRALDMKDEVIVPSYTFIATAHALSSISINPVFADIDPVTHCLCPDAVRSMITSRTSGIIGVHLWGQSAPVEALQQIADEHGLQLMFDAAHAFGCSREATMIGNFGRCEVLSFHATKFFNTFEGGAILTNDSNLAEKFRLMRNFGFAGLDNVIQVGTNGKMNEVAAAMGLVNFDEIENIIEINRRNFEIYSENLINLPGIRLMDFKKSEKNNYQYVVLEVDKDCSVSRDQIIEALYAENILARKYFWPGCHNMKPYIDLYPDAGLFLPNTKLVSDKVIVLPTGPAISEEMIKTISSVISIMIGKSK